MNEKFQNKYRISSARMRTWDYGSHGLYFITICTKNRKHFFGDIISTETHPETQNVETQNVETQNIASLRKTIIGEIAYQNWLAIPEHFQFVELDDFALMPNHIHAILFINKPDKNDWTLNKFGVQSQNLASVVRGYKASVKAYATTNDIEFNWQPRYHDRVIRDEKEYINIKEYIYNNPENWFLKGDDDADLYL